MKEVRFGILRESPPLFPNVEQTDNIHTNTNSTCELHITFGNQRGRFLDIGGMVRSRCEKHGKRNETINPIIPTVSLQYAIEKKTVY